MRVPTYEYVCDLCRHGFELFQSITAKSVRECPKCKKKSVRRVIQGGAGVLFKGSGFYQTDYRSKNYTEAAKKEKSDKKDSSGNTGKAPCGPSACKQPDVSNPDKK